MDVILIPGFWLDGSSWGDVITALEQAGHHPIPVTLPGLESADIDRSGITLRDHVDAVIGVVDEVEPADTRVVLVGHSGGGAVAHAVADARPDRVARVVYVDAVPLAAGQCINDRLPVVDGEVPLPDWSEFGDEDLVDLDEPLRAAFRERAIPTPARVASDPQQLGDDRRYDVPSTVIACEFPSSLLQQLTEDGTEPFVAELAKMRDVTYVDLPTGHWPQFTRPADLARVIVSAVG